jgi:hypothetical protein
MTTRKEEIVKALVAEFGIKAADKQFTQDELIQMFTGYMGDVLQDFVVANANRMSRREAMAKTSDLIKQAEAAIQEAEKIAKEYEIELYWEGFAYGMGGSFGKHSDGWCSSGEDESEREWSWQSSSQSC